jgi:hypothetical protein
MMIVLLAQDSHVNLLCFNASPDVQSFLCELHDGVCLLFRGNVGDHSAWLWVEK